MIRRGKTSRRGVKENRGSSTSLVSTPLVLTYFVLTSLVLTTSCSKQPPPDFAPDPGLLGRIRSIDMSAGVARACPGSVIPTTYTAVLDDGSRIPFAREYRKDRPPQLHVVLLHRLSEQARSQEDGDWVTDADPLLSLTTGFRIEAEMKHKPDARGSKVVPPAYDCIPHAFTFTGATGEAGLGGGDGPDVTVRLGVVRSPFYDRLIVAGIEVGQAPPFYVFYDGTTVPPADWLVIETRGGRGGRGAKGAKGTTGAAGRAGCPGERGGTGGKGGNGGAGGPGGRGGRVTIIAPQEEPFLAGIVDVQTPGGEGGPGGAAGDGGDGGDGGAAERPNDPACRPGTKGAGGETGTAGAAGPAGRDGPRARFIAVPARDVFGPRVPPQLAELL